MGPPTKLQLAHFNISSMISSMLPEGAIRTFKRISYQLKQRMRKRPCPS